MSNKRLMQFIGVWDCPDFEEVTEMVKSLCGINAVCRITKKHRNTISKWCSGKTNIDYANWKLISEYDDMLAIDDLLEDPNL